MADHGTYSRYRTCKSGPGGGKCAPCKAANARRVQDQRQAEKGGLAQLGQGSPNGGSPVRHPGPGRGASTAAPGRPAPPLARVRLPRQAPPAPSFPRTAPARPRATTASPAKASPPPGLTGRALEAWRESRRSLESAQTA